MTVEKRFKHFDRKFKEYMRTDGDETPELLARAKKIDRWEQDVHVWPQHKVQHAVYDAPDAEQWQKFRVSLKGQSTRVKLARLRQRHIDILDARDSQYEIEKIRIDNYIGSLVRGGQLDDKYRVVK